MSYFLQTSLPCFLAVSATVALAAGGIERFPERDNKPSAGSAAHPLLLALGGQQEDTNDSIFLEGLWPVLQREHSLWFVQGGWQRQQRNLLSLGLGWRYSPEAHWGLGYNLFYDQDTTEHQRRIGLGAEAWLHTLTLSANGYLPAKGWRAGGDLKDYQQRVASGYDVILRGYLPFLPQLGASVRYAHYFGDEVAWGSASQRHKNPQQWRWGIDFTPIPLLTLAYHRHTGCSGHAKQQISAVVSYRFDLPFSQQVDPNQVAMLHSAAGQRLARVNRERTMALKYAKIPVLVVQRVVPPPQPQPQPQPQSKSKKSKKSKRSRASSSSSSSSSSKQS